MSSRKVVVADDNRMLCASLRDVIELFGHSVYCAFDGRQVIQETVKVRPNTVLMGMQMSAMDGLTALKEIKRLAPQTQVLLMSASLDPDFVDLARHEGADAVLLKPPNYDHLLHLINGVQQT